MSEKIKGYSGMTYREIRLIKDIQEYRELSAHQLLLIDEIKDLGVRLRLAIKELESHEFLDQRWVAIARTDFQTGLMALTRAIAKPGGF